MRTWVTAVLEMDGPRVVHPSDDPTRKSTERYSDDIERMQREFRLRLLMRKGVRV